MCSTTSDTPSPTWTKKSLSPNTSLVIGGSESISLSQWNKSVANRGLIGRASSTPHIRSTPPHYTVIALFAGSYSSTSPSGSFFRCACPHRHTLVFKGFTPLKDPLYKLSCLFFFCWPWKPWFCIGTLFLGAPSFFFSLLLLLCSFYLLWECHSPSPCPTLNMSNLPHGCGQGCPLWLLGMSSLGNTPLLSVFSQGCPSVECHHLWKRIYEYGLKGSLKNYYFV